MERHRGKPDDVHEGKVLTSSHVDGVWGSEAKSWSSDGCVESATMMISAIAGLVDGGRGEHGVGDI